MRGLKKSWKTVQLVLVVFIVLGAVGAVYHYLEWEKPRLTVDTFDTIGREKDITITVRDAKSGVKSISVALVQNGREFPVTSVDIPQKGIFEKVLAVKIIPRELLLQDGEATFRVKAVDFSPLKNKVVLESKVLVDSVPPRIALLSTAHNINPGGTCLAVYRVTKPVQKSGVKCGDLFFPGYLVQGKGKPYYVCYFAIPRDVTRSTSMAVQAVDKGGNETATRIPFYVRATRAFRKDTVSLGDSFVQQISVTFQQADKRLAGKTPPEIISYVNTVIRTENDKLIRSVCAKTSGSRLWQGTFLRMKNSAPKALFGDERTYQYQGSMLGNSVHLGVDLASTAAAPVEAVNNGTVLYADDLGIYGNCVIIDHGQGISSLYGHLSSIAVKAGQQVTKGQVIANSGATGFAGGDHLHLSILVNGIFVDPKEWWDAHWIRDNVEDKINSAQVL
jgi:murein DD-endopeptidase MepM/ murein hydrolase activator NlpD